MRKVPNALFVIDPRIEHNAVAEARKLKFQYSLLLTPTVIQMWLTMSSSQ